MKAIKLVEFTILVFVLLFALLLLGCKSTEVRPTPEPTALPQPISIEEARD